jgi:Tol biopolymer transport system component
MMIRQIYSSLLIVLRVSLLLLLVLSTVEAQVLRQVSDKKIDGFSSYCTDDAGEYVFAVSKADPDGTNPQHAAQVVKWELLSDTRTQLTFFTAGVGDVISVTDDGLTVAIFTNADPVGSNPDHSRELFLMQAEGTTFVQLTNNTSYIPVEMRSPVISGSGNRVLFLGTIDPQGTNPNHLEQLFIVDSSTLQITQLTTATGGEFEKLSISDTGRQIAFVHSGDLTGGNADGSFEVFKIDSTGLNLTQVSSSSAGSIGAMVTGDGRSIVYQTIETIYSIGWGGGGLLSLAVGSQPSITDDGFWIYLSADDAEGIPQIYKVFRTGGTPTQLTSTVWPVRNIFPVVSGLDGAVIFTYYGGEYPGESNPDDGFELMVVDNDGANAKQLTANGYSRLAADEPEITSDGTRIVYKGWGEGLVRVQSDGSDSLLLHPSSYHPSITADGNTVRIDPCIRCNCNCPLKLFSIQGIRFLVLVLQYIGTSL